MRAVSIIVFCDACEQEIEEEAEGASTVLFTVRGEQREMELCDACIGGTFLQEARSVTNRTKRKSKDEKPFSCWCGKSFGTVRGLSAHQARQAHD